MCKMSLQDIEFITTDDPAIKVENDVKLEIPPDKFYDSIVDTLETEENGMKCGEIFVSKCGSFTLICALCATRFDTMRTFGVHLRSEHSNDDLKIPVKCNNTIGVQCTEVDDSQDSIIHNRFSDSDSGREATSTCLETERNPESEWKCEICQRHYKLKSSLTRHMKCHQVEVQSDTEEDKSVDDESSDNSNCKTESVVSKKFICEICNGQYSSMGKFRSHALRHENQIPLLLQQDPTYLKCKYCSQEFTKRLIKLKHESTHDKDRPFQCHHCPKTFRDSTQRDMHLNVHTGERPFKCTRCPRAFSAKNYLTQHVRSHIGIKKFVCEVCGQRFLRNVERNIHMRRHTGERPYQCEECGKNFMVSGHLFQHRLRHTKTKKFKCEVCGSVFYSNKLLKEHKVMHSDDRPHKCSDCGRSFPRRKALKAHEKIHSDVKEYVCDICGKAFAQAAGLYSHKKSHGEKMAGLS